MGLPQRNKRAWMCLKFAGEDPQKVPSGAEIPADRPANTHNHMGASRLRCMCVSDQ